MDKQIEKYHKDGFLVVKNVFTREECNNFKKILIEEIEKGKDALQKHKHTRNLSRSACIVSFNVLRGC